MALWNLNDETARRYRKRTLDLKKEKEFIINSGGFFRSDKGGERGARIDYVERRQAVQMKKKIKVKKQE